MALSFIVKKCRQCEGIFQPTSSRQVHCSLKCRFWSKVDVRGADECWPWLAGRNADGYGNFGIDGKTINAHRVSFELTKGPLKHCALHTCDWPPCCNFGHLWDGTKTDNMADCKKKGRGPSGSKHGMAKLIERDVLAIRADSRFQYVIAADYGVTESLISQIKHRTIWDHI